LPCILLKESCAIITQIFVGAKESRLTEPNHELRKAGLKVTLPRLKILEILAKAQPRHMSAEDVYKTLSEAGEEVGLATVYRVLTQFEVAGLIKRHNFEEGHSVFEMDHGEHHDHLVCVKCSRVEEFIDEIIEKRQAEIAEQAGLKMTDHNLTIYGFCRKCGKGEQSVR
jgi:Fur family transcriptional regulator, ferric uptake regulator